MERWPHQHHTSAYTTRGLAAARPRDRFRISVVLSFAYVADADLASSAQGKRCVSAPKGIDDCRLVSGWPLQPTFSQNSSSYLPRDPRL